MNISNKYLAGFLDSDGSVGLQFRKLNNGKFTVQARVSFKQRTDRNQIIQAVADEWGVTISHEDVWAGSDAVILTCQKAVRFLERIKNFLVIKYDIACLAIELNGQVTDNPDELRDRLSVLRKSKCSREKSYPSRKWLAGYFDGDGCITITTRNQVLARFTSWIYDTEGVELIKKQFGGSLLKEKNCLRLNVSSPIKLIEYFHDDSILKKAQLQYVLEHMRKGTINSVVKCNLSKMKTPASTERTSNLYG